MTLVFTMITSLILGIGVPTTANYVITSTIAAPALLALNVPIVAAHMFVFYFGIIADVTPPVCLAAVAASGVAKSEPMRTGLHASRLAIAAFLIPFVFVFSPQMLLIDAHFFRVVYIVVTAFFGMILVAAGLTGFYKTHMNPIERLLFAGAGVALVTTHYWSNAIAIVVALVTLYYHLQKAKRRKAKAAV